MNWVKVAQEVEVSSDEATQVFLGETAIALLKVSDQIYAFDDVCSHEHAYLSEGFVDGNLVECPLHGSQFEVQTGKPVGPPATQDIATYEVKVDNGCVYLKSEETS